MLIKDESMKLEEKWLHVMTGSMIHVIGKRMTIVDRLDLYTMVYDELKSGLRLLQEEMLEEEREEERYRRSLEQERREVERERKAAKAVAHA